MPHDRTDSRRPEDGIRVYALCPDQVNTPLLQELLAPDPDRAARRLVHIPLGRIAEPEEIGNAVLWLASDESSFRHGEHVPRGRWYQRGIRHVTPL